MSDNTNFNPKTDVLPSMKFRKYIIMNFLLAVKPISGFRSGQLKKHLNLPRLTLIQPNSLHFYTILGNYGDSRGPPPSDTHQDKSKTIPFG